MISACLRSFRRPETPHLFGNPEGLCHLSYTHILAVFIRKLTHIPGDCALSNSTVLSPGERRGGGGEGRGKDYQRSARDTNVLMQTTYFQNVNQHNYRKSHSTETALLKVTSDTIMATDAGIVQSWGQILKNLQ